MIFKAIQTIFYLIKLKINTILVNFLLIKSLGENSQVVTFFSSILLFFFFLSQNIFAQTFFYWGEIYLTNFTSLSIFKCTFSGINSTVTQASPLPPEFFHHPVQNLLNNNSPSPPPPPTPRKHLFYVPFPWIWLSWVSRKCDVNNICPYFPSCLAYFIEHNVFKIHSCCGMYQKFIPF